MKKMEKILVVLVFAVMLSFLAGCGFVPIQKEMLMPGEALAVDIEGYTFYEGLKIVELGDGKSTFSVDRLSPLRSDNFSKEVGKIFEEKFPAELRARGIIIDSRTPMKIKIHLAFGDPTGMLVLAVVLSFREKFEINIPLAFPSLVKKESIPFGEWRDLASVKVLAERLSEHSANGVITQLREKGEIKIEKK